MTVSPHVFQLMVKAIRMGALVPFLGAGASLCERPAGSIWEQGTNLPSSSELSRYLADLFDYPKEEGLDLTRVSQYAALTMVTGPLYQRLHQLFDVNGPTRVHQFLAAVPAILRQQGTATYQLIVTTNYDTLLEEAFEMAQEPYDLVAYEAEGPNAGRFWHRPPNGEPHVIDKPNEYAELSLKKRSVILKIHGTLVHCGATQDSHVITDSATQDSYVITEDNYIDFLAHTNISELIPSTLLAALRNSHILFLGYSLRDWNLRVVLRHIWMDKLKWVSWAIQLNPNDLDMSSWEKHDVSIFDMPLEDYINELEKRLKS